jgi:hypothetical protein
MQNSFVEWDVEKRILAGEPEWHVALVKVHGSDSLSAVLKIIWLSQENTTAKARRE